MLWRDIKGPASDLLRIHFNRPFRGLTHLIDRRRLREKICKAKTVYVETRKTT